jgi:hypothetical protein
MAHKSRQITALLATFLTLELAAYAQQSAGATQEASQPPADNSSSSQPAVEGLSNPDDALEVPVLEQQEEEHVTYVESHIALKYNHDEFEVSSNLNRVAVEWLQAFGPSERLAAGIEIPFLQVIGERVEPNASGLGDIEVQFRGMLTKGGSSNRQRGSLCSALGEQFSARRFPWRSAGRRPEGPPIGMGVFSTGYGTHSAERASQL